MVVSVKFCGCVLLGQAVHRHSESPDAMYRDNALSIPVANESLSSQPLGIYFVADSMGITVCRKRRYWCHWDDDL
jgi:hypothetical protein